MTFEILIGVGMNLHECGNRHLCHQDFGLTIIAGWDVCTIEFGSSLSPIEKGAQNRKGDGARNFDALQDLAHA